MTETDADLSADDAWTRAWEDVVQAEDAYSQAVGRLPMPELSRILAKGVESFGGRSAALRVLRDVPEDVVRECLPALTPLLLDSHSLLQACRRVVGQLSQPVLGEYLTSLVEQVVTDDSADYESYRRLAELLREHSASDNMRRLVVSARESDDPDVLEVADDFGPFVEQP